MPRRSIADDGTERKAEVDNHNGVSIYPNFTLSRRSNAGDDTETKTKTARVDDFYPSTLPEEMIFEILSWLPAQVVHDLMRCVCDEWKSIISRKAFIYNHLWNSTPGIIIMEDTRRSRQFYVEMRRGSLEICKFDFISSYLFQSSVNGLGLVLDHWNKGDEDALSIINPLTKQQEALPCASPFLTHTTLAVNEASTKYKAVHSADPKSGDCASVLTIGVDNNWRYIDTKHISEPGRKALTNFPFATRGYVHWTGESSILTLNVETEMLYEFPRIRKISPYPYYSLAMGRNLSFCYFSKQSLSSEYMMEVIEMNSETGEWTNLLSSDLKPLSDKFKSLKSVELFGVLDGGEVFLFGVGKLCAAYNVRTREIQSFELEKKARSYYSAAHMNSMIWYK